ncbi:hypothetical protein GQ457_08G015400 [Hibiscus cannabinus]
MFSHKKINVVLDESNFLLWKQQVLLTVRSHRLEDLLTGKATPPAKEVAGSDGEMIPNEEYGEFVAQDSALASWLLSTVSSHLLSEFVGAETAAQVWEIVLKFFAYRSTTAVMSLHCKLRTLKKGDDSMRTYLSKIKEVCDALGSCGIVVSKVEHVASILNGLPREYQSFVAVITANTESFSLDKIRSLLVDAETQLGSYNAQNDFIPVANVAQSNVQSNSRSYNRDSNRGASNFRGHRGRSFGRGRGRVKLQCQLCGKIGHLVDRCWFRFDQDFPGVTAVTNDQEKNEMGAVNLSAYEDGGCSCCAEKTNVGMDKDASQSSHQVNVANLATTSGTWVVDSGATHHVTPDSTTMLRSSSYNGPGKLACARDNDVFFEFHADTCYVRDERSNKVLLQGRECGGLYKFEADDEVVPGAEANVIDTSKEDRRNVESDDIPVLRRQVGRYVPHEERTAHTTLSREHTALSNAPRMAHSSYQPVHEDRMHSLNESVNEGHVSHGDEELSVTMHGGESIQENNDDSPGLVPGTGQQLVDVFVSQQRSSDGVQGHFDEDVVPGVVGENVVPEIVIQGNEQQQLCDVPVELAEGSQQHGHSMITRSKAGIYKPKVYLTGMSDEKVEPTTIQEALLSPEWKEAVMAEFNALQKNVTWKGGYKLVDEAVVVLVSQGELYKKGRVCE